MMSTVVMSPESATAALQLDHLRALEAESIHIMREVVAEFERAGGLIDRLVRRACVEGRF